MAAEGLRVVTGDEESREPARPLNFTDLGNALRLLRNHAQDLVYCTLQKSWYVWDGNHFARDEKQRIQQLATSTAVWIQQEETQLFKDDPETRLKIFTHGIKSESAPRIAAMTSLAESDERVAILASDLDVDPYLFNVKNGTLDLRTGSLREHDRADWITKLSPVEFDPEAESPAWLAFLQRVMDGSNEKIAYLQRWFGYCMTGDTSEEVLAFFQGSGRNGKTKCIQAIEHVFGDYAHSTQAETIMRRDHRENSSDIAALLGARLVSTSEIEDGARMAESLVKQLTGSDRVTARRLYADYFTFTPTFKLLLAGNHKPIVRGTDNAIWERIHLVPFTVTIPPDERDPNIGAKLRAEAPGILNWLLEGCLAWQAGRLQPPNEVRLAVNTYRQEMDILGGFIEEYCYELDVAWEASRELYKAYQEWCGTSGERPVSKTRFGLALAEKGYAKDRESQPPRRWIWRGIGLLVEGQVPEIQVQSVLTENDQEEDEGEPF